MSTLKRSSSTTDEGDNNNSNSGTKNSNSKRPKKHSACQQCRNRKIKCYGEQPTCSNCLSAGSKCIYTEPKKRGFPPGYIQRLETYANGLERLLGSYIHTYGELELLKSLPYIDDNNSNDVWRKSSCYSQLYQGYNNNNNNKQQKLGSEGDIDSNVSTNSNNYIFKIEGKDSTSQSWEPPQSLPPQPPQASSAPAPNHGHNMETQNSPFSVVFEISVCDRNKLLDWYFSYIHCWFPVINKAEIGRWVYTTSGEDLKSLDINKLMLLYTILSISAAHTDMPKGRFELYVYNLFNYISDILHEVSDSVDTVFESELERIQTLLLGSIIMANEDKLDSAWITVGVAVRLAYQKSLNQFDSTSPYSTVYSKRTWYGCCIIDTFISARVNKVPHIRGEDFYLEKLPEEGPEEWELWKPIDASSHMWSIEPCRSLSIYNSLFQLCGIYNKLISYTNKPSFHTLNNAQKAMVYNELSSNLQLWSRNLPEYCNINDLTANTHILPPQKTVLFLSFITVNSLIYLFHYDTQLPNTTLESTYNNYPYDSRFLFTPQRLPIIAASLLIHVNRFHFFGKQANTFMEYFSNICVCLAIKYNILGQAMIYDKPVSLVFFENDWITASRVRSHYYKLTGTTIPQPAYEILKQQQLHSGRQKQKMNSQELFNTDLTNNSTPSTSSPQQPPPPPPMAQPELSSNTSSQQNCGETYWDNNKMSELFDISKQENRYRDVPEFLHNLGLF